MKFYYIIISIKKLADSKGRGYMNPQMQKLVGMPF